MNALDEQLRAQAYARLEMLRAQGLCRAETVRAGDVILKMIPPVGYVDLRRDDVAARLDLSKSAASRRPVAIKAVRW